MARERFYNPLDAGNGKEVQEGNAKVLSEGEDPAGIGARPAPAQDEGRRMKLLACPFCGGEAAMSHQFYGAYCIACGAQGARYVSDAAAVKGWNTRHQYVSTRKKIAYIDPNNRGIVRFYGGDEFDGILAGERAQMIVDALNGEPSPPISLSPMTKE